MGDQLLHHLSINVVELELNDFGLVGSLLQCCPIPLVDIRNCTLSRHSLLAVGSRFILVLDGIVKTLKSLVEDVLDICLTQVALLVQPWMLLDFVHFNSMIRIENSHLLEKIFEFRAEEAISSWFALRVFLPE